MKTPDPFAACPVRIPFVRARADRQGRLQLKHSPPPGHGVRGFFARYFRLFRGRRIFLDERGSFFWNLIDGRHTLAEIERELARHYDLETQQSRDAVILFTKMLMRRGLIGLKLPSTGATNTREVQP
jgi:hypothetical protein